MQIMKKNKHLGVLFVFLIVIVFGVINYKKLIDKDFSKNNSLISDKNIIITNEADQKEGATIEINEKLFDFGVVKYGDIVSHVFKITNQGSEDLEIFKISTSCGCTKASVEEEDKIILPGKTVDLIVTFDPAVHKDDTDLGELQRIIYIKTNDLINEEAEVKITANVIK